MELVAKQREVNGVKLGSHLVGFKEVLIVKTLYKQAYKKYHFKRQICM